MTQPSLVSPSGRPARSERPRRARAAFSRALALATSLAVLAPSLPAFAQTPPKAALDEASSRFKKGVELYKEGDYRAALIEFKRAYELAPNFNVLYNMGQVYFQLQDYVGGLSSLERYLSEGGSQIPASRRAEVTKDIEKLRSRVAKLEIVTNVADADITVDDLPVGKSPLAKALLVSAGRRKVTASKTGYASASKLIDVAGADSQRVSLDLTETAATPAVVAPPPVTTTPEAGQSNVDHTAPVPVGPAPAPPPGGAHETSSSAPMVIGWSLTAGLTAGAVVCGVLALGASSDLKTTRESAGSTRSDLDDAKSKTTTLALVTDILAAGAVVAGGVSIYLTAARPSSDEHAQAAPALRLGLAGSSLRLDGTF